MWLAFLYFAYPHSPTIQKTLFDLAHHPLLDRLPKLKETVTPDFRFVTDLFIGVDWFLPAKYVPLKGTKYLAGFIAVLHVLEALFCVTIVRKNVSGFFHGVSQYFNLESVIHVHSFLDRVHMCLRHCYPGFQYGRVY